MKIRTCLRCGADMTHSPWHICPRCGKWFAFYTPTQVALLFAIGIPVAIGVNVLLVVLLWNFA
jgi:hypothetical protein